MPEDRDTLRAYAAIIPVFVEEALRWITPAKHFMRCATVETELRGRTIHAGDWMYVSYASANRDEEAFEAPFEFRPNRKPIKHVSFGFGRSEEHTSELQSLMRISYAVFCLKKKK